MAEIKVSTIKSWKRRISKTGSIIKKNLAGADITHKEYAEAIQMNNCALSRKLGNKSDCWTYGEILMLIKQTEMSDEDILKLMKF